MDRDQKLELGTREYSTELYNLEKKEAALSMVSGFPLWSKRVNEPGTPVKTYDRLKNLLTIYSPALVKPGMTQDYVYNMILRTFYNNNRLDEQYGTYELKSKAYDEQSDMAKVQFTSIIKLLIEEGIKKVRLTSFTSKTKEELINNIQRSLVDTGVTFDEKRLDSMLATTLQQKSIVDQKGDKNEVFEREEFNESSTSGGEEGHRIVKRGDKSEEVFHSNLKINESDEGPDIPFPEPLDHKEARQEAIGSGLEIIDGEPKTRQQKQLEEERVKQGELNNILKIKEREVEDALTVNEDLEQENKELVDEIRELKQQLKEKKTQRDSKMRQMRLEKEIQLHNKFQEERERLIPARLAEYKKLEATVSSLKTLLQDARKEEEVAKGTVDSLTKKCLELQGKIEEESRRTDELNRVCSSICEAQEKIPEILTNNATREAMQRAEQLEQILKTELARATMSAEEKEALEREFAETERKTLASQLTERHTKIEKLRMKYLTELDSIAEKLEKAAKATKAEAKFKKVFELRCELDRLLAEKGELLKRNILENVERIKSRSVADGFNIATESFIGDAYEINNEIAELKGKNKVLATKIDKLKQRIEEERHFDELQRRRAETLIQDILKTVSKDEKVMKDQLNECISLMNKRDQLQKKRDKLVEERVLCEYDEEIRNLAQLVAKSERLVKGLRTEKEIRRLMSEIQKREKKREKVLQQCDKNMTLRVSVTSDRSTIAVDNFGSASLNHK